MKYQHKKYLFPLIFIVLVGLLTIPFGLLLSKNKKPVVQNNASVRPHITEQNQAQQNNLNQTKNENITNNPLKSNLDEYSFPSYIENKFPESLPWENDERFLNLKEKHHTNILMAKYKVIYTDPLPGELYNLGLASKYLSGNIINPNEIFSQTRTLGPITRSKGYISGPMYKGTEVSKSIGGGICNIASTLYNLARLCNFPIIERHNHSLAAPEFPPGQDATVYSGVKDIKFKNNTKGAILIWAQRVDNALYMAFYGTETPPQVTWIHQITKIVPYTTLYKKSYQLPKGQEKILLHGYNGYIVKSWLRIQYPDGREEMKALRKDYYNPINQIIEKGMQ
jgi:vancomycin resistance protein VanW